MTLHGVSSAARHVAGVVEIKVLFRTIYGHANCLDSASGLVREIIFGLAQFANKWLVLGDFNMTADDRV